ncbi:hypothetical protein B0H10DRAFT_1988382 [Mycena sp. CBHHK59/15]|nr:hypothetical protein B0H10DRAFT_1988382 [Mycena sp. CBHHK59/15]
MLTRTRIFAVLRSARPLPVYRYCPPRRTLSGLGSKPQPPATPEKPTVDDAELQETMNLLFKDKPDAVKAVVKFAGVMSELGVSVTSGEWPGPMQLMKLAANPKFRAAFAEVDAELKKAGVDARSKEFGEKMMKLGMRRGP